MSGAIHVLGAGSLGLLFGFRLADHDPVVLLRRRGWQGPARAHVTVEDGDRRRSRSLDQIAVDAITGSIRRLLLATKAQDALTALRQVQPHLSADAQILLLQNGMGSQHEVAAACAPLSVDAAVTTEGGWRPQPEHVVHAGHGTTTIGALRGHGTLWAELLAAAGFRVDTVHDIDTPLADKLRVNAVINPLSVRYDCRNGELLERPDALADMALLGRETDAVLAAAGYRFGEPTLTRATAVARATAANISSMLQDWRAGRTLEIDYINGYVVQLGERQGVATPMNRALWEQLGGRR